jgi:hypothetical protein
MMFRKVRHTPLFLPPSAFSCTHSPRLDEGAAKTNTTFSACTCTNHTRCHQTAVPVALHTFHDTPHSPEINLPGNPRLHEARGDALLGSTGLCSHSCIKPGSMQCVEDVCPWRQWLHEAWVDGMSGAYWSLEPIAAWSQDSCNIWRKQVDGTHGCIKPGLMHCVGNTDESSCIISVHSLCTTLPRKHQPATTAQAEVCHTHSSLADFREGVRSGGQQKRRVQHGASRHSAQGRVLHLRRVHPHVWYRHQSVHCWQ